MKTGRLFLTYYFFCAQISLNVFRLSAVLLNHSTESLTVSGMEQAIEMQAASESLLLNAVAGSF